MTDSEFNLKRTLKKKVEQNLHSQGPVSNRSHLRDSVGGLLSQSEDAGESGFSKCKRTCLLVASILPINSTTVSNVTVASLVAAPQTTRSAKKIAKHNASAMSSILQHNEEYR